MVLEHGTPWMCVRTLFLTFAERIVIIAIMANTPPDRPARPPTWAQVVGDLPALLWFLALIEWPANWWVWLWRRSAGVRTIIEFAGAAIIVAGVYGLYLEREDRKEERVARAEERLARMWELATNPRPGNSGKIPALEFLNNNGHQLTGIKIPGAYLPKVNLSGAEMSRIDLSGANLFGANLKGANLFMGNLVGSSLQAANLKGASLIKAILAEADLRSVAFVDVDLTSADLSGADLYSAFFDGANLLNTSLYRANVSGAYFSEAKNLTQRQLDFACVMRGSKFPELPEGLTPPKKVCPEQ